MENTKETFTYTIERPIAVLSQSGNVTKELNLVSFSGKPAKYDIRSWRRTDGQEQLLKGITLTKEELSLLRIAINDLEELL